MSALCSEKTSVFRFNTSLRESSFLSDNLTFRCFISGRTGLTTSNSMSVGLSGKFEKLDSPSSVSHFMEITFLKDFNSLSLFCKQSW